MTLQPAVSGIKKLSSDSMLCDGLIHVSVMPGVAGRGGVGWILFCVSIVPGLSACLPSMVNLEVRF